MTSLSEKHMEAARELMEGRINSMCMTWDHSFGLMNDNAAEGLRRAFRQISYHDIVPFIATALASAEHEGMRRAAEIVRSHVPFMPPDGPVNAAHQAEYEALGFAMQAIISEIGDHP